MRQPTRKVAYQHLAGVVMEASISTNRLAIFAYGSLLFRPGFAFMERQRARAPGYARSFSQASPDHRGTPERPGRVLTLAPRAEATTAGAVYFVEAPALELLSELDYRERAGYQRINLEVWTDAELHQAVTWIAPPGNPYDAGQLPLAELALHIRSCHGPSGANSDYVFQLEQALAELQSPDPLVSELSALLRR
ncbi:MAG TPA: gamma-glutamylcyclotransferase [Polyangiaceae bacterium]|nr:gamma-glutamylcyclotransferase [Polyangiaceae bacterium]